MDFCKSVKCVIKEGRKGIMDKIINVSNVNRGLFLETKEDYMQRIEHLAKLINEKYPEIADSIDVTEIYGVYKSGSLHELVSYHDKIYKKVEEVNKKVYRPYWKLRAKLYS